MVQTLSPQPTLIDGTQVPVYVSTVAQLAQAYAEGSRFFRAHIVGGDFANIPNRTLRDARIIGSLVRVDLRDVDLRGADLSGAELKYSKFSRQKVKGVKWPTDVNAFNGTELDDQNLLDVAIVEDDLAENPQHLEYYRKMGAARLAGRRKAATNLNNSSFSR